MKPDKHFITATCIASAAICLAALTWIGPTRAVDAHQREAIAAARAALDSGIRDTDSGIWTASPAGNPIQRIDAFGRLRSRNLPSRGIVAVGAMNGDEEMRPAAARGQEARIFAGCTLALLIGLAVPLVHVARLARQREALMVQDQAVLAAANEQLEGARAMAAAKAEQLEVTLTGMSDGVSMVDRHFRLVEWNARFPEIAGVPADLLRVGLPMEEILLAQIRTGQFGPIADPRAEIKRRMARLRAAPFGMTQRLRPDGRTLELRRNRLPDGGFVTLYSDITDHKRAEAALREATAAAELANAEKSRFVAIVSHEIRTPLNALLNTIRLLSDSALGPAQQSLLVMAHRSGDVLFGLINDILDISQMEAGKLSIRPSLFDLRGLLETSAQMFADQAAERGITIRVAVAEGAPESLLTDPARLRQVQLNLLSNAIKYARSGEVRLTAEPGRNAREAVRLSVKDDGPVIGPDARQRLFRPFSRLERPEGDAAVGTGLGLSICHHLVTLMGGEIGCDAWSAGDGRAGNAFWVALPQTVLPSPTQLKEIGFKTSDGSRAAGQAPVRSPSGIPRRSPPRTRILLTEDILANQLVTATMLRRAGHHVDVAASGPAAITAVKTAPYDLIFMDSFMPGMSGQEATRIIRSLPEPACSIPIIALTGSVGSRDEAIFEAAGMQGVLRKPASLEELIAVLVQHVWQVQAAEGQAAKAGPVVAKAATVHLEPLAQVPVLATERIEELRVNLPPETFASLVEDCLADLDDRLPALRRALLARAPGAVEVQAHAMAGMAASYGMAALEARLRLLMNAVRDGNMSPLGPAAATALEADVAEAASQMREMLRSKMLKASS